jgi:AraC-like DNA-binding protein
VVTPIEEKLVGAAASLVDLLFNELRFLPPEDFSTPRLSDPRLRRIEDGLRRDPGDTRSTEDWARLAQMSSRTLSRRIHEETSMSFADWRQQLRLNEAVVRLVEGESVTSVALSLGYENVGSFSRMFKRVMSISPSELASARDEARPLP